MRNFAPCLALTALLAGCLPGTSFNVTLRLEGEDGKPIPDALVLAGAYLTVAPPLEPPYDRPMAAVRGMTDAKGIVRLSRVDGFYVGETPQDPLWKMLESRKPKIERSVIGVEGGSILVFAPGYGLVEQPFGSEDNAAFQARRARVGALEVRHYYSWFRTGDEHEWFKPIALLHAQDFVRGKTLTIKLAKPRDAEFSLKSFSTRVLVRSAIATSTLTGTTEEEKARIYQFFRSQTAYAASISTNPFYAEQLDEFDNPKFRRWFMTQDISRAGAGTLVNVWMTEKALGLLPHPYDEVKRYVSAIQEGVRAEEETPRYWNHFYNPHDSKNSGPRGQTALQWAAIDNPDNPSNEWDWEDALRYYRSGDRAKAYKALGHVLHLLEDMSVPERTHLIDPDEGSSAFEEYFSIVAKRNFESLPWAYSVNAKVPIRVRGFREHFDVVAGLTFGPMKDGGKILDFDDYYQALPGASGKILRKPDEQTLGWMGEYIFPRTIEYAAGLMEHFYDTVQPRTAVKEGPVGANEQVAVARSSGTEMDKFNKFTSGTDTKAGGQGSSGTATDANKFNKFTSGTDTDTATDTNKFNKFTSGTDTDTDINEVLDKDLTRVAGRKGEERTRALRDLREKLQRLDGSGVHPSGQHRKALTDKLAGIYDHLSDRDKADQRSREVCLEILTVYGDSGKAKQMAFDALDNGPEHLRRGVLGGLTTSKSPFPRDEVFSKIKQLRAKGIVTRYQELGILQRVDGARVLPEIRRVVLEQTDKQEFIHFAKMLQAYENPEDVRMLLARIFELKLHEKFDAHGDGLFWVNSKLFARYLESAQGEDIRPALRLVELGGISRVWAIPAIVRRGLINDADSEIRIIVADQLAKGAGGGSISPDEAEKILQARFGIESDSNVRAKLGCRVPRYLTPDRPAFPALSDAA